MSRVVGATERGETAPREPMQPIIIKQVMMSAALKKTAGKTKRLRLGLRASLSRLQSDDTMQ